MKEANVKKLFVKVFSKDGSTKSLLVDESMKCGYVMRLLADKHHVTVSPRWGLVEHLPELHMGMFRCVFFCILYIIFFFESIVKLKIRLKTFYSKCSGSL